MTRYIFYLALILIFSCNSNENSQPNIVLIIGDDHGWPYYGFMGNDIVKTPVLDSLANSGTVFTNGHVTSSICRPSLRTLLTGLYPIQFDNYLDSMKKSAEVDEIKVSTEEAEALEQNPSPETLREAVIKLVSYNLSLLVQNSNSPIGTKPSDLDRKLMPQLDHPTVGAEQGLNAIRRNLSQGKVNVAESIDLKRWNKLAGLLKD